MKIHFKEVSDSILDIKFDKRKECFNWGADNAQPSLIETLFRISVTAKTCIDKVGKAIYGKSFGELGKVVVNSKGQTLNEVLRIASRWYARHNNCFLQIAYDGNYEIKSINVLPVTDVRIGKADDKGYSGKFLVYNNWDKSKGKNIKSDGFTVCDKFNPDVKIVAKQVVKVAKKNKIDVTEDLEGALAVYNGQIVHLKKDDSFIYSPSDLEPVKAEALFESNATIFRSEGAEDGFINTKLMTTAPFKGDNERKDFKKNIDNLRGVKKANKVLLLETSVPSEDVSKQVNLQDLTSVHNDKLFEYSEKQAEKNISKVLAVPKILFDTEDSGSFGDSGGKLLEAKIQLWNEKEEERIQVEELFGLIMRNFGEKKRIEEGLKIINPYEVNEDEEEAKNINKEAQAKLRGTAGGVAELVKIASAVKTDILTKESAVSIVKNIFGFTDKKAKEMIGGFEDEVK